MSDNEKPCDCLSELMVGVEIQGVYDGVLFWQCQTCGARWHRFPEGDRRRTRADELWARWDKTHG